MVYTAFAVFVSFTRLYLGVHKILDVLGGVLIVLIYVGDYFMADLLWSKAASDFLGIILKKGYYM